MSGIHVKRGVFLLLCAALLFTTAFASAPSRSDISIRITPPESAAEQRAGVEIQFTDNIGTGLQAAHVKLGGASWQEITGQLNRTDSQYYYIAEITENCTLTARAIGQDGTVFEKSEEISCFDGTAKENKPGTDSSGEAADKPSETAGGSKDKTVPLTPKGQGSVLDNAAEEDGKEFFTFTTPNENVFYLVVDRQKDNENVYFLNAVTESDLMELAEKDRKDEKTDIGSVPGGVSVSAVPEPEPEPEPDPVCNCEDKCVPGEVNTKCPVCTLSYKDCEGKAPAPSEDGKKEPAKPSGNGGVIFVVIAALAAGGAGYYFKIYKRKRELDEAEDLEDLTVGEDVTIDEDDENEGSGYEESGGTYAGYDRAEYSGEDEESEPDESNETDQLDEPERPAEPEPLNEPEPSDEPEPPDAYDIELNENSGEEEYNDFT